jgi:hypothetical protein
LIVVDLRPTDPLDNGILTDVLQKSVEIIPELNVEELLECLVL